MSAAILPAFRFLVTLGPSDAFLPGELLTMAMHLAPGAFQSATGLDGELEVLSYAEGGRNDYVHQLPVRHSWGRIRLSRGIASGAPLWDWYKQGLHGSLGARRDGTIIAQNAAGQITTLWSFTGGLAAHWKGPEYNAEESKLSIESLEIAHQGLSRVSVPTSIGSFSVPALPGI